MLSLEPTDDLARPAFKDAASCTQWLSQLQLTNLNLAHGTLRKQLDELNRCPIKGSDRLQTLEALRETIAVVQNDFAKKLVGKRLPLAEDELSLILALSSLWQSMLNGYLRCLQSAEMGDKALAAHTALLRQRCLRYSSLQIGDFLRAGYEPEGKTWQQLHALYAHIESLGLQNEAVRDERYAAGHPTTCRALYSKTLLMHRARLLGLSRSHWHIAERWLNVWSDAITIEPRCSISKADAPPLGVDLAGTQGLQSVRPERAAVSMRYLAMVPLSKLIRVKTILLQQGQTPQQVDLGSELSSQEGISLLNQLHACWCEARPDSMADTARDAHITHLCIGLEQIYAQLARKPFKPVKDTAKSNQDVQHQIETFGRVLDETGQHTYKELGFVPEEWLVEEESLIRGRFLRKALVGERLANQQLVSVFAPNDTAHKLGVTTLVNVTRTGQLYIGLHFLPGHPQAVIVRGNADGELLHSGSAPALLLPAMERLSIPASLVLPREWFKAGRSLEMVLPDTGKQNVTLGFSVEKGSDFERVSFTLAVPTKTN
ncbi:MAG: hypothetical protein WCT35_03635 [Sideroxydans sp.]|jgi:hypothetical protein